MLYHTNTTYPSKEAFLSGLLKTTGLAQTNDDYDVLIAVHTLKNMNGVILTALGEEVIERFSKARVVTINSENVYLETEKIQSPFRKGIDASRLGRKPPKRYSTEILTSTRHSIRFGIAWAAARGPPCRAVLIAAGRQVWNNRRIGPQGWCFLPVRGEGDGRPVRSLSSVAGHTAG